MQKKQRMRTGGTKRKGAPDSKKPKKSATKKKPKLSPHINPWTISSGALRTQSLRATIAAAATRTMTP